MPQMSPLMWFFFFFFFTMILMFLCIILSYLIFYNKDKLKSNGFILSNSYDLLW